MIEAQITAVNTSADGTFQVTYEFFDEVTPGVMGSIAAHTQGFPAGTERATVEEAIRNYARDVLPNVTAAPPVVPGDSISLGE